MKVKLTGEQIVQKLLECKEERVSILRYNTKNRELSNEEHERLHRLHDLYSYYLDLLNKLEMREWRTYKRPTSLYRDWVLNRFPNDH